MGPVMAEREPKPYSVVAGNPYPRNSYRDVLMELNNAMRFRAEHGAQTNRVPMALPANASRFQLGGLFGGGDPSSANNPQYPVYPPVDISTKYAAADAAPSPGLGSGVGTPMVFEDGGMAYDGQWNDPLLKLLTILLNNRFPNGD